MSRDYILHKTRTALGRSVGQAPAPPPPPRIVIPDVPLERRIESFTCALEKLAGKVYVAASPEDARGYIQSALAGRSAIAANHPVLEQCGIPGLDGVQPAPGAHAELKAACAAAGVGITSADYGLADTGSLAVIASPRQPRLVSLLPPAHISVLPKEKLLTGLDELFTLIPRPAELAASLVLITGPSRTADIEQILVRGVHGPGEIHVVLI